MGRGKTALWIALLVAGCAKDVTKDFEELANKACACADKKDAACGNAVLDEMITLVKESRNVKGDERKAAEASKRLGECLLRSGVKGLDIATKINAIDVKPEPTPEAPATE